MSIPQVPAVLAKLADRRPVFHSEADFQHALAWELQLADPTSQIFLEKWVAVDGPRVHLDLLVRVEIGVGPIHRSPNWTIHAGQTSLCSSTEAVSSTKNASRSSVLDLASRQMRPRFSCWSLMTIMRTRSKRRCCTSNTRSVISRLYSTFAQREDTDSACEKMANPSTTGLSDAPNG